MGDIGRRQLPQAMSYVHQSWCNQQCENQCNPDGQYSYRHQEWCNGEGEDQCNPDGQLPPELEADLQEFEVQLQEAEDKVVRTADDIDALRMFRLEREEELLKALNDYFYDAMDWVANYPEGSKPQRSFGMENVNNFYDEYTVKRGKIGDA